MFWTPRPYQPACIDLIVDTPRCAIWAKPGMGKTSTVLAAIDRLDLLGELSGPVLVLGPLRVARDVWSNELAKWENFSHMTISPIVGTTKQRLEAVNKKAMIYTTNYENIPWLVQHFGDKWPFVMIIADESTRLKGYRIKQGGKRSGMLGKVAWLPQVKRFVNLTGTPSPNGLIDLWGQTWFLDQGRTLGTSYSAFVERWFYRKATDGAPSHHGKLVAFKHSSDEIQERLKPFTVSLDPKDWFDLREPIVTETKVQLPSKARAIYKDLESQMFSELEDSVALEVFNAASLTMKCLQLANGAVIVENRDVVPPTRHIQHVHDEKLEALESIVEEAGCPVLVAYNFVSDKDRILKHFGADAVDIATKSGMERFKAGLARVGVAHPKSVGHGVDGLQNVTNVLVRFGHDWNLEERLQMLERIGPTRQAQAGLERPVLVYDLIAEDTVDEDVLERHRTKAEVQDILMAAMKRSRGIFDNRRAA